MTEMIERAAWSQYVASGGMADAAGNPHNAETLNAVRQAHAAGYRAALAAATQAEPVGHGGISSCGCSWIENVLDGKVVRSEHFCETHKPAQQRPALVTALRGLLASLQREPTEFELRAAAHEFTLMADRAAAAARAGGDDA